MSLEWQYFYEMSRPGAVLMPFLEWLAQREDFTKSDEEWLNQNGITLEPQTR